MSDTDTVTSKKPAKSNLLIQLGLVSMHVSLWNPYVAGYSKSRGGFKMSCPAHPTTPHGVKQKYVCGEQGEEAGIFDPGDCGKMKDVGGNQFVAVPAEAIEAVKEVESTSGLTLAAHPYETDRLLPGGDCWIVEPAMGDQDKFHAVLLELVDEAGRVDTESGPKMLVGEFSVKKGSNKFVRLERWNGHIVLRSLLWPEDLHEFETHEVPADPKLLAMASQLIEAQAEDFDPEEYREKLRQELDKLVEDAKNGNVVVPQAVATKAPVIDITALLEASLKEAKSSKPKRPAKKAAKATTKKAPARKKSA